MEKKKPAGSVVHPNPPIYDQHSTRLILGTMASPQSRERRFYYAHPQNRFWPTLAGVFGEPCPQTNEEKKALLLRNGVALWDVIASCDIVGASDQSIRNVQPNPIEQLIQTAPIRRIYVTGRKAQTLYQTFCQPATGMEAIYLPSSSPANARLRLEDLIEAYKVLLQP